MANGHGQWDSHRPICHRPSTIDHLLLPRPGLALAAAAFGGDFSARAARFAQADRDRLLAARDPLARAARAQRAVLAFVHRALDFLLRLPAVLRHATPSAGVIIFAAPALRVIAWCKRCASRVQCAFIGGLLLHQQNRAAAFSVRSEQRRHRDFALDLFAAAVGGGDDGVPYKALPREPDANADT